MEWDSTAFLAFLLPTGFAALNKSQNILNHSFLTCQLKELYTMFPKVPFSSNIYWSYDVSSEERCVFLLTSSCGKYLKVPYNLAPPFKNTYQE